MPVGARQTPTVVQPPYAAQSRGALQQGMQGLQQAYGQAGQAASVIQPPQGRPPQGASGHNPSSGNNFGAEKRNLERQKQFAVFQDDLARSREGDMQRVETEMRAAERRYTTLVGSLKSKRDNVERRRAETLGRLDAQIDAATDPLEAERLMRVRNSLIHFTPDYEDELLRLDDALTQQEQAILNRGRRPATPATPERAPDPATAPPREIPTRPAGAELPNWEEVSAAHPSATPEQRRDLLWGGGLPRDPNSIPPEELKLNPEDLARFAYQASRLQQISDADTRKRIGANARAFMLKKGEEAEELLTINSRVYEFARQQREEIGRSVLTQYMSGMLPVQEDPGTVQQQYDATATTAAAYTPFSVTPQAFAAGLVQGVANHFQSPQLRQFVVDALQGKIDIKSPTLPDGSPNPYATEAAMLAATEAAATFREVGDFYMQQAAADIADPASPRAVLANGYNRAGMTTGGKAFSRDALMKAAVAMGKAADLFEGSAVNQRLMEHTRQGRFNKLVFSFRPVFNDKGIQTGVSPEVGVPGLENFTSDDYSQLDADITSDPMEWMGNALELYEKSRGKGSVAEFLQLGEPELAGPPIPPTSPQTFDAEFGAPLGMEDY